MFSLNSQNVATGAVMGGVGFALTGNIRTAAIIGGLAWLSSYLAQRFVVNRSLASIG